MAPFAGTHSRSYEPSASVESGVMRASALVGFPSPSSLPARYMPSEAMTTITTMATATSTFPAIWYNKLLRFKTPAFYVADADVEKAIKLELAPR